MAAHHRAAPRPHFDRSNGRDPAGGIAVSGARWGSICHRRSSAIAVGTTPPALADRSLAICVRGLHKSYGSVEAVRGLDLEVRRGQIVALLGPNGAGKTTTMEVIEGLKPFDSGSVEVLGKSPMRARRRVGVQLQEGALYDDLTCAETIRRIRATLAPAWVFLAASVVSQLVLVAIQIAVQLGVGHLLYGIGMGPRPLPLLLVLLVGSLCFLGAGFLVAALSRREQAAVVMSNLISLPQLFVAGVFYPLSGAPLRLQKLSIVMPLTYFSDALRGLMAEGQTLGDVTKDIVILLAVGVAVLVLAARTFKFEPSGR